MLGPGSCSMFSTGVPAHDAFLAMISVWILEWDHHMNHAMW